MEVKLPQWGMAMGEGTVIDWLVTPGQTVSAGDDLVEVEAAKVVNVVVAPIDGTVGELLVPVGETVPVNTVLCTVRAPGEAVAPPPDAPATPGRHAAPPAPAAPAAPATAPSVQVVPMARKLAREHDIDLATVTGSGPGGRILVADVEAVLAVGMDVGQSAGQAAAEPPPAPMSPLRRSIAQRMLASIQTTAQYTLTTTADVTRLVALREGWADEPRPSFADAVVRACALALLDHPGVNARMVEGAIVSLDEVHVGLAVAVEGGLVVPVVRHADRLALGDLAAETLSLGEQARARRLPAEAYAGGTFTVTSLGGQGIDAFTPILNPPESGILGVGRIRPIARPGPEGNGLVWRSELTLSLTLDHRVVDGYPGALFLADVVANLEDPTAL